MIIYIVAVLISVFFALLYQRITTMAKLGELTFSHRAPYVLAAVLSALPLFAVAAFRYRVGSDYQEYARMYGVARQGGQTYYEIGFLWLNKALNLLSSNAVWLFVVCALVFIAFMFHAIYRQSDMVALSVALLVLSNHYFIYLNQMRQYVALAFFLYALRFIDRKKPVFYFIWVGVAVAIHKSVLILAPLYFLRHLRIPAKIGIPLAGGVWLASPLLKIVVQKVVELTPYAKFFILTYYNTGRGSIFYIVMNIGILLFMYLVLWKFGKEKDKEMLRKYYFYINVQLIAVFTSIFYGPIPQMDRVMNMFTFVEIISIPTFCALIQPKKLRAAVVALVVVSFAGYTVWQLSMGHNDVLPYRMIFDHKLVFH